MGPSGRSFAPHNSFLAVSICCSGLVSHARASMRTNTNEPSASTAAAATIRRTDFTCDPLKRERDFFCTENAVSCRIGLIVGAAEEPVDVPAEVVGVERLGLRRHGE